MSRKRGEPLDFSNLPELAPDALALADPKDITLKTWGTKAPTLLPEDLHYKVLAFLPKPSHIFNHKDSKAWIKHEHE